MFHTGRLSHDGANAQGLGYAGQDMERLKYVGFKGLTIQELVDKILNDMIPIEVSLFPVPLKGGCHAIQFGHGMIRVDCHDTQTSSTVASKALLGHFSATETMKAAKGKPKSGKSATLLIEAKKCRVSSLFYPALYRLFAVVPIHSILNQHGTYRHINAFIIGKVDSSLPLGVYVHSLNDQKGEQHDGSQKH
jgi:hypothetical protein